LQLSRQLAHEASPETLPALQFFLQVSTGIASAGSASGCLAKICKLVGHPSRGEQDEYDARKGQLERANREAERLVDDEVCQAVRTLHAKAELVRLTRKRLLAQQEKVRDLEDKVARGLLAAANLLGPRSQATRLEADVVHEVAEWHIARIKLKQAQGLLVVECQQSQHAGAAVPAPTCGVTGAGTTPCGSGP
jgi:hypothetical protein